MTESSLFSGPHATLCISVRRVNEQVPPDVPKVVQAWSFAGLVHGHCNMQLNVGHMEGRMEAARGRGAPWGKVGLRKS